MRGDNRLRSVIRAGPTRCLLGPVRVLRSRRQGQRTIRVGQRYRRDDRTPVCRACQMVQHQETWFGTALDQMSGYFVRSSPMRRPLSTAPRRPGAPHGVEVRELRVLETLESEQFSGREDQRGRVRPPVEPTVQFGPAVGVRLDEVPSTTAVTASAVLPPAGRWTAGRRSRGSRCTRPRRASGRRCARAARPLPRAGVVRSLTTTRVVASAGLVSAWPTQWR